MTARKFRGLVESYLPADSGLLQKEVLDAGALDHPARVEMDVNVLPKTARVVIADGLGVAKGCGGKREVLPTGAEKRNFPFI